jgi:hypothetical protein
MIARLFRLPTSGKVAIKVIQRCGDEVMKAIRL